MLLRPTQRKDYPAFVKGVMRSMPAFVKARGIKNWIEKGIIIANPADIVTDPIRC